MSSFTTLGRLLLRPLLLWNLFVAGSLTLVFWALGYLARGGMHDAVSATGEQLHLDLSLELAFTVVLVPMALGAVLAWTAFELLLCPFAALLPRLGGQLFRGLLVLGLLTAAGVAWWCDEQPGHQEPLLFFAQALLWFSLGVLWIDPITSLWGRGRWLVQALPLLVIFAAPELARSFEQAPLVQGPLAVLLAGVLLALPFRPELVRLRAIEPACSRSSSYRELRAGGGLPLGENARLRSRWRPSRTLSSLSDWTGASLHEAFGHARGGWVATLLANALVWTVVLCALGLVLGFGPRREATEALEYLLGMLLGRVPDGQLRPRPIAAWALPVWSGLVFVSLPYTLSTFFHHPLSRARRALVAWRTSLRENLVWTLGVALLLALAVELCFRLGGFERVSSGLPSYLRGVWTAAIFAPLAQGLRLRLFETSRSGASVVHSGQRVSLLAIAVSLPATAFAILWELVFSRAPVPAQVCMGLCLLVSSQLMWRAHLEQHYRTRDLAA